MDIILRDSGAVMEKPFSLRTENKNINRILEIKITIYLLIELNIRRLAAALEFKDPERDPGRAYSLSST